jgi:hypothetical protein
MSYHWGKVVHDFLGTQPHLGQLVCRISQLSSAAESWRSRSQGSWVLKVLGRSETWEKPMWRALGDLQALGWGWGMGRLWRKHLFQFLFFSQLVLHEVIVIFCFFLRGCFFSIPGTIASTLKRTFPWSSKKDDFDSESDTINNYTFNHSNYYENNL